MQKILKILACGCIIYENGKRIKCKSHLIKDISQEEWRILILGNLEKAKMKLEKILKVAEKVEKRENEGEEWKNK